MKPVEECKESRSAGSDVQLTLFATKTCPNCKIAEKFLTDNGVSYVKLLAEENAKLVETYGVRQAPTLVVTGSDGFETYAGLSEIMRYVNTAKKAAK